MNHEFKTDYVFKLLLYFLEKITLFMAPFLDAGKGVALIENVGCFLLIHFTYRPAFVNNSHLDGTGVSFVLGGWQGSFRCFNPRDFRWIMQKVCFTGRARRSPRPPVLPSWGVFLTPSLTSDLFLSRQGKPKSHLAM